MPIVLLIRHGENDYARRGVLAGRLPGVHLNENGLAQAQRLAEALGGMPIRAIYSSPLERAMETGRPLASQLGLTIQKVPGLIESDVGSWEGKSVRRLSLSSYWRIVQQSPSRAGHPGGEKPSLQTQVRVVHAIDAICERHTSRGADRVRPALGSDQSWRSRTIWACRSINFQRLGCDPASVTMLSIRPEGARLLWLNRQPPFLTGQQHPDA